MEKIYIELNYRDGNGGIFGPAWVEGKRQAERLFNTIIEKNIHRGTPMGKLEFIPSSQWKVKSNDWDEQKDAAMKDLVPGWIGQTNSNIDLASKHTPGPWITGEPYLKTMKYAKPWFIRQIGPAQPSDDIQIGLVHAFEDCERDAEMEANARLIAAAPEMLEMLNKIKAACEEAGQYTSVHGELIEFLGKLNSN